MHELLTTRQMAEADRLTIAAGTPGIELMENAGRAVADAVSARFPSDHPVLVVAGPGNNGGDGFVAARLLKDRGYPVRLMLLGERSRLKGDAALAAARWEGETKPAEAAGIGSPAVVIDALFGAGLDRPIEGAAAKLVDDVNRCGAFVLAVDLPSGINGDSGAVMGCAVEADATVTFFRKKPGHLLLPGRLHCGPASVADIGIKSETLKAIRPNLFENDPAVWGHLFPFPTTEGHKYSRGHAVVVSGAMASTGAARLAARAALRAGAGLVTIASPHDALAVNAAASFAVMVREAEGAEGLKALLSDPRINTVVIGPGGGVGPEMRDKVRVALAGKRTVILDADALTSFGDNPKELFTNHTNHPESTTIHTPHEGEFHRTFNWLSKIPSVKQKLEACLAASHETAGIVILKGADTVVAAPDGRAMIADNAPPWLATAGAGDVLAGLIAGLCAQGMPAFEASAAAVWLHGEAAREFGPGLIAEDLTEALPKVYRRLHAEHEAGRPR
jgi:hydroxyethylthiazole kinase-like uncharacterized protein yjeF